MSELLKNIDARTKLAGTNKLEILLFFSASISVPVAGRPMASMSSRSVR